jgi:hypothetical protein
MSIRRLITVLIGVLTTGATLAGTVALAETKTGQGNDVQMVLTVADHMNHQPAFLKQDGLTIMDGTITDVIPLKGRDLELFILIDDAANYDFSSKLQELRHFVNEQPNPVAIGVAYIHDGALQVIENPTTDHRRVAAALRPPSGSKAANPYCAVSDLIQRWERKSLGREIVLVSTGIDETASEGAVCVNAETAIQDAERAGVIVYALYNPVANYPSQKWSKVDAGVVDLAHVAYETGGEAYFIGHSPTATLEPFLADISEHLGNQYLVKFHLTSTTGSGLQMVHVIAGSPDQELMTPDKVMLPDVTGVSGH